MNKKHIQQTRMMSYFLDAACRILEEEGLKELTVRRVAELAGYHYSTIYNYFKDLNDLIVQATLKFFDISNDYVKAYSSKTDDVLHDYIMGWEGFCSFSLEYPNIFRCMFVENFGDSLRSEVMARIGNSSLFKNKYEAVVRCVEKGYFDPGKVVELEDILISICVGKVLMYVNGRTESSKEEILDNFKKNVRTIIENNRKRE